MKVTGFSRVSKEKLIGEIEKELKERKTFFVAQHGTISAPALDRLRVKLRQSDTRYFVIKNSLGKKAFDRSNMKAIGETLTGSCGIAFTSGDIVASSKILVDFAKENETFRIQTASLNGELVGADKVKVLASLPSKEVLIARVLGGMQAPISKFVGVLSGTIRKIVTVLDAVAKKKSSA